MGEKKSYDISKVRLFFRGAELKGTVPPICPTCGNTDTHIVDDVVYCYSCEEPRCAAVPVQTSRWTRGTNSGKCDTCGFDMYEDGVTADTHAPDCSALIKKPGEA